MKKILNTIMWILILQLWFVTLALITVKYQNRSEPVSKEEVDEQMREIFTEPDDIDEAPAKSNSVDKVIKAVQPYFPEKEIRIISQVAREYKLTAHQTKLLFVIRRIENGGISLTRDSVTDNMKGKVVNAFFFQKGRKWKNQNNWNTAGDTISRTENDCTFKENFSTKNTKPDTGKGKDSLPKDITENIEKELGFGQRSTDKKIVKNSFCKKGSITENTGMRYCGKRLYTGRKGVSFFDEETNTDTLNNNLQCWLLSKWKEAVGVKSAAMIETSQLWIGTIENQKEKDSACVISGLLPITMNRFGENWQNADYCVVIVMPKNISLRMREKILSEKYCYQVILDKDMRVKDFVYLMPNGLELGVGDGIPNHPARRYAGQFEQSLRIQAQWAAGTIIRRYDGNLKKFAVRYCERAELWHANAKKWLTRLDA